MGQSQCGLIMTTKIPPEFPGTESYGRYRSELMLWKDLTELPPEKQAISVAFSLPKNSKIRDQVLDEMKHEDLKKSNGLDTLIAFMDKKLGKDDLTDLLEKYDDFDDFKRQKDQSIVDYIDLYDQKYNRMAKLKIKIPSEILAFRLLKRADLNKQDRQLVLTGLDFGDRENLYEQAQKSLKKFLGEMASGNRTSISGEAIKLEPAFVAEEEEAYVATGYGRHQRRGGWRSSGYSGGAVASGGGKRSFRGGNGAGKSSNFGRFERGNKPYDRTVDNRPANPKGADGARLLCKACGSYRHFVSDCPYSYENMAKVNITSEETSEHVVLFTGADRESTSQLGSEARNCAVLDSACSSTVCGEQWLNCYLESLSSEDRSKIVQQPGYKIFKFGGGEKLKSQGSYGLPAQLANREVTINTDVVKSDIPLLLSKSAMKKAKVKLDLEHDRAEILGVKVALNATQSGHYCVPIDRTEEIPVENVCAVKLQELSSKELHKTLVKLHRQFAHPTEQKLIALLKDAGVWDDKYQDVMNEICESCQICKMYSRTPPRPVVAMPLASKFNEKVAMDLKKWKMIWILYLVDLWSRYTVSVPIQRKKPEIVIDKMMLNWISVFGVMEGMLSDNGGEFSSDETREVASKLNITVLTTAGECPFQNGTCERIHAITDVMLSKLQEDFPKVPLEVLCAWASMARNSLQMWNGYSSHQLVFGSNPNVPNVITDNIPALEGSTTSEVLAKHLNVLHAARQGYIQAESCERVRRALRSKVRASQQVFQNGDLVFYKREGYEKWLGPGKVVFQDGRIVFVRHGGTFVRVSPNRLIKLGSEFSKDQKEVTGVVSQPHKMGTIEDDDESDDNSSKAEMVSGNGDRLEDHTIAEDEPGENVVVNDQSEAVNNQENVRAESKRKDSMPKKDDIIQYRMTVDDPWVEALVLGRAGKATGRNKDWMNVEDSESGEQKSVDLAQIQEWRKIEEEVNMVMIPRNEWNGEACVTAKKVELEKLREFCTYEVVEDVGQMRVSTTWVIWKKGEEIRARLVARGYEEECIVQKDSPTMCKSTLRLFLTIASSQKWKVKSTDIKSAFLQGKELSRDVYLTPPKEACVPKGSIWKLRRCLYGLNDAARQFYESVVEVLVQSGCTQSQLDPALYYLQIDGKLVGMVASHIDDFLHCGEGIFDDIVMERLKKRFLAGRLEEGQFRYIGFRMNQNDDGIMLDQEEYVEDVESVKMMPQRATQKLESLSVKEHTELRGLVGRLNWAVQGSRPDMAFEMIELSTKFKNGIVSDLVRATKSIRKLKDQPSKIYFPNLGVPAQWKMVMYSDASHANLNDGVSSMGAHVVFLVSEDCNCCVLSWHAKKIRRVVRSTLAAETLALQEGIEDAVYLRKMLVEVLNLTLKIPLLAYCDCRSVVEAVHSTKMVDDRKLRIDIGALRESLQLGEITSIQWCPGSHQLANCMTKRGADGRQLLSILQTGRLSLE